MGWDGWAKGVLAGRLLAGGALLRVQLTFPLDTEEAEIKDLVGASPMPEGEQLLNTVSVKSPQLGGLLRDSTGSQK